ncbi:MAG: metal-dependent transcriptional regulator [Deltaproteobacteria bacterium]|nr:metal-dependent transcriptional regulator [Deltaproteobacteria bacterium]
MPEITPENLDFPELSASLENYIATIHKLSQTHGTIRVKDIAAMRQVKPGSVSPAMQRLSRLGLIDYTRRESISLTVRGRAIAETLIRRQRLLTDFFEEILKIPSAAAQTQAEAVAHCLTAQSTARLEGLIRFVRTSSNDGIFSFASAQSLEITIAEMMPGQTATVRHIRAQGELNHQLIDMGLLPDSSIQLISGALGITPTFVVALQGYEITLSSEQANAVVVSL